MIAALLPRYWPHIGLALALLLAWHFHARLLATHADAETLIAAGVAKAE